MLALQAQHQLEKGQRSKPRKQKKVQTDEEVAKIEHKWYAAAKKVIMVIRFVLYKNLSLIHI